MIVLDVKQGTDEWLRARAGIPTASELDNIVSPTLKLRTGEMPQSYAARKVAERWLGYPMQSFSGGVMEQGSILESEAIPLLEIRLGATIERHGFITTDDGTFGCSPDGVFGCSGLEIKCPQPPNHVRWLTRGGCPPEHLLQCHGGMYVTGAAEWKFVSYCRGLPLLMVRVTRSQEAIDAIGEALRELGKISEAMYAAVLAANGGNANVEGDDDHPF